ncbi:MAG: type II secretion system F family protein [Alphaproteobacteria bacterium]
MQTLKPFTDALSGNAANKAQLGPRVHSLSARDRERLFFLMAMMFKCGHTTVEGLRAVARAFRNEKKEDVSAALHAIAQRVAQGKPLSKAMETEHIMFSDLHRAAILAGEAANNMEQSFDVLRTLETKRIANAKAGFSELLTPFIMMLLSLASVFNTGLNTLPVMAKLREAQGKPLGSIPAGIMDVTTAIAGQWYILLAVVIVTFVVLYSIYTSKGGKYLMHAWLLRIPVYGRFLSYRTYTNMLLYFPYMLKAGVRPKQMIPIMEALSTNLAIKRRIESFNHVITTGGTMSEAMGKAGFPEIAVTPVEVSENYAGNQTDGVNNVMIEGMQHAYHILEQLLDDTHRTFVSTFSAALWLVGGTLMLLDMVSIVLSQG